MTDLTQTLRAAQEGDPQAAEDLTALLYEELRDLARREMGRERAGHTLQPTAVVNEAYLRLVEGKDAVFVNRESFFAAAATSIRRVLVDHARKRAREKHGGRALRVSLEGLDVAGPPADEDLLALDEVLERLASLDSGKARLVELRFFGGLSMAELGKTLGASESTVQREWRLARAWLRAHLDGSCDH